MYDLLSILLPRFYSAVLCCHSLTPFCTAILYYHSILPICTVFQNRLGRMVVPGTLLSMLFKLHAFTYNLMLHTSLFLCLFSTLPIFCFQFIIFRASCFVLHASFFTASSSIFSPCSYQVSHVDKHFHAIVSTTHWSAPYKNQHHTITSATHESIQYNSQFDTIFSTTH